MRIALSWGLKLVVVTLVLGQWLAYQPGEVLAQESLKQLTESTDDSYLFPSISADGARIAYWSLRKEEIYVINSDGTGFRRLVGGNLRAEGPPSISADGQWIAFYAEDREKGGGGHYLPGPTYLGDVYLMRTNGTGLRQLTPDLRVDGEPQSHLVGRRGYPVISGDGSLVVFPSSANFTKENGDGSGELFVVRSNGTGLRQVTNTTNVSAPNIGDIQVTQAVVTPAVDHSGSRVAFWLSDTRVRRLERGSESVSTDASLYVVNTDGSGLRKLSVWDLVLVGEYPGEARPAISGDGSRVAFVAAINVDGGNPDRNLELFTVKTDGTGFLQLTNSRGGSAFPSVSFDGSRIAFTHSEPFPPAHSVFAPSWSEVYAVNPDGSGLTRLTKAPAGPGNPPVAFSSSGGVALSADGTHVAFSSDADLVGKNADHTGEIYVRRVTSLLPVQGIRNEKVAADLANNRHSLVARRDLVVRAFFDTGAGGPSPQARGRLVVDEGTPGEATFQVDGYAARPQGYFDDKPDARLRLEDSLNFFITGRQADDLLAPGIHTFKARVEPQGITPWEETFQATFRQPDTVDVFIIPVRVRNAAGALVAPDAALLEGASDFLRATYPLDESRDRIRNIVLAPLEVHWPVPFDQPGAPDPSAQRRQLAQQIRAVLDAQLLVGAIPHFLGGAIATPARQNFAAGVVPYAVDGLNPIGVLGYTFLSIRGVVVSLDRSPFATNPPVIGSTIAHEVGHQLGLGDEYTSPSARPSPNNPPPATAADGTSTGNYVLEIARGLDNANRVAVFNRPAAEFLGYMGGGHDLNSWARGIDYSIIYTQVTTDTVGGSWIAEAPSTRFINVSGVMSLTGGIQLRPFLVATSPYTFTRPSGTQYFFQFRSGSGAVLDTVGFDVDFTKEVRGVGYLPVDQAPFSFTVPLPESVASMAVLTGTTPMITYTVSAQPPAVTVLAPNGGETLRERGQVRWQASDPDGDALTYTVLYSPNGTDRYVVATNVTTTTLDLDFSRLPPGDRAYVIVRASDGFNYAEDASDAPLAAGPWRVFLPLAAKGTGGW